MKIFITLIAIGLSSINVTVQEHSEKAVDKTSNNGSCGCCCGIEYEPSEIANQIKEESKRQTEFRTKMIEKLNDAYETTRLKDRGPEIKLIELHLLSHRDYTRCMVCNQIYGPGVKHMYRHPFAYGSDAEMWQFHEKIQQERVAAQ